MTSDDRGATARERLAAGLDPEQLRAVSAAKGAVCVIAGAGSGKTRVLTHRAAWMASVEGLAAERVLAVAFTNEAVEEMRGRLRALVGAEAAAEMVLATFHAAAWRLCVRPYRALYPRPITVIYSAEDAVSACRRALRDAGLEDSPREVLGRIAWAKAQGIAPSELESSGAGGARTAAVWRRYRALLRSAGALDFEDLLAAAVWLLSERAEVRRAVSGRFDAVLVDEYQDASPLQHRLVELIAPPGANLTVVGDDDQALFGFRGGDARSLRGFDRTFAGARRLTLGRNYRSREAIVSAAARLIAHNPGRPAKALRAVSAGGRAEFRRFADEAAEAEGVAAWIEARLEAGTRPEELAVLARTSRYLGRVEQLLVARRIAYRVLGRRRLTEHAEVRDVVALVGAARVGWHREALARAATRVPGLGVRTLERVFEQAEREGRSPGDLLRRPGDLERGIAGPRRVAAADLGERLRAVSETLQRGARAGVVCACWRSGWAGELQDAAEPGAEARRERLRTLVTLADRFDGEGDGEPEAFLAQLALAERRDGGTGGVTLATIHAAKGREWDRVALVGAVEGQLPHRRALEHGEEAIAAERCAAYVAMTRARHELCVSTPERLAIGGRRAATSRFVAEAGLG
ncbi:MAG: ATP-dependent helicase [Candidatus Limnocylindria bacterium]